MKLSEINPYLRYASLQPWVLSDIPLRKAYDYRIFYILEGEARFLCGEKKTQLSPGNLLYFRPGVPYGFEGRVKGIVLNFDMTRAQAEKTEPRSPIHSVKSFDPSLIFENDPPEELQEVILLENGAEMEEQLRACLYHFSFPSHCSDALSSALLKEILCFLVRKSHRPKTAKEDLAEKLAQFLQQNYDRPLCNEEISAAFGYHSYYLNRVFKEETGMTLHQGLLQGKIRVAKRLLRGTSLSVSAVAAECGFAERTQFCTLFKKHTGRTPSAYRKGKPALE